MKVVLIKNSFDYNLSMGKCLLTANWAELEIKTVDTLESVQWDIIFSFFLFKTFGASILKIRSATSEEDEATHAIAKKQDSKVVIRNIRRDAMEKIKNSEKNKEISKDESFQFSEDVQKITDKFISLIDSLFQEKEKDILKV